MKRTIHILLFLFIPLFSKAQILENIYTADTTNLINYPSNDFKSLLLSNNKICVITHFANPIEINQIETNNNQNKYRYDSLNVSIYTTEGVKVAQHLYPLVGSGYIEDMVQLKSGEILLGGEIDTNLVFIRLDSLGNYLSSKNYPNTASTFIKNLTATYDNHVLVSYDRTLYDTTIFVTGKACIWGYYKDFYKKISYLAKIDSLGNVIWNKQLSEDKMYNYLIYDPKLKIDILNNPDNSFNVLKTTVNSWGSNPKVDLLHFDKNGNIIEHKTLVEIFNIEDYFYCTYTLVEDYCATINENYYSVIKKSLDTSSLTYYTYYYFDKTGILIDSSIKMYNYNIYPEYASPIHLNRNDNFFFKSNAVNKSIYWLFSYGIFPTNGHTFILMKTDEDALYNWEHEFDDGTSISIRKGGIMSLNDSTLLVVNLIYDLSAGIEHLKFYKISLAANQIYYSAYIDVNNNGIKDGNDTLFNQGLVEISDGTSTNTFPLGYNGTFSTFVKRGTFVSKLVSYQQNIKYFTVAPETHTSTFDSIYQSDTVTFRLVPIEGIQDLQVFIVPIKEARPGSNTTYQLIAKNIGTKMIQNISLQFIKDSLQTFSSYSITPTSINNDTLIWNFDSIAVYEQKTIDVICTNAATPQLNVNDTLRLHAFITPFENDSFVIDNSFQLTQVVLNAYDPNDKIEAHGSGITRQQINNGDYLYYTIRFQNTGNASASIIKIVDTLSNNLDWSTLEILNNTHNLALTVSNKNILTWYSNSVFLPDSTNDEAHSHGYISFRIKPKTNLLPTDKIENRAHIYFDFNPAITTNTVTTSILEERTTSIRNNTIKEIHLFPSPTNGDVQLEFNSTLSTAMQLHIVDINGKEIRSENIATTIGFNSINISLNNVPKGIYLIQLNDKNQNLYYGKVVKQ
ncbi:MAG: T9SS type A sorting domain-containing protein [Bacteroidetes bacterium]|nr:T9SS type A sorting domain-containing protein [Bacteroidota bacterium]